MEDKANAVLQLLPDETHGSAEVSKEGEMWRITLEGVNDPERTIDTVVYHAQTLLAPEHRLDIVHQEDRTIIDLQERLK